MTDPNAVTAESRHRREPRVRYVQRPNPALDVDGDSALLLDLSMHAIRLRERGHRKHVGDSFHGYAWLRSGHLLEVDGKVLRVQEDEVTIELTHELPVTMFAEERRAVDEGSASNV